MAGTANGRHPDEICHLHSVVRVCAAPWARRTGHGSPRREAYNDPGGAKYGCTMPKGKAETEGVSSVPLDAPHSNDAPDGFHCTRTTSTSRRRDASATKFRVDHYCSTRSTHTTSRCVGKSFRLACAAAGIVPIASRSLTRHRSRYRHPTPESQGNDFEGSDNLTASPVSLRRKGMDTIDIPRSSAPSSSWHRARLRPCRSLWLVKR